MKTNASTRRRWLFSIGIGLLIFLAGAAYAMTVRPQYQATTHVVVVPPASATIDQSASLFDSLSRGQITATAASILNQSSVGGTREDLTISAGAVTPSAVVSVAVTAPDAATARRALSTVISEGKPMVDAGIKPYVMRELPDRTAPEKVGLGRLSLILLAAIAGALGAAATAYLWSLISGRRTAE